MTSPFALPELAEQDRPIGVDIALERGHERLRKRGVHRPLALRLRGGKRESRRLAVVQERLPDRQGYEVLDPERAADQERDHQAVTKRERALKQGHRRAVFILPVGRRLRLGHQREAQVLEPVGGLQPDELVLFRLGARAQIVLRHLEPGPIARRRHHPDGVVELLDPVEDGHRGAEAREMLDVGEHRLPGDQVIGSARLDLGGIRVVLTEAPMKRQ